MAKFAPNAQNVAHIDIDAAEIGKVKTVTWSQTGDAAKTLKDLIAFGKDFRKNFKPWHDHVLALKKNHALNYKKTGDLVQPQEVIEVLNEITQGEAIIATSS